jgi:hypothetical protein
MFTLHLIMTKLLHLSLFLPSFKYLFKTYLLIDFVYVHSSPNYDQTTPPFIVFILLFLTNCCKFDYADSNNN